MSKPAVPIQTDRGRLMSLLQSSHPPVLFDYSDMAIIGEAIAGRRVPHYSVSLIVGIVGCSSPITATTLPEDAGEHSVVDCQERNPILQISEERQIPAYQE